MSGLIIFVFIVIIIILRLIKLRFIIFRRGFFICL